MSDRQLLEPPEIKQQALALYVPPFKFVNGYIRDSQGLMMADQHEGPDSLRIRGWGRIQYLDNPELLQDTTGELIAQALTEFWERNSAPC